MHNCSDDVLGYHDNEVTLPQSDRDTMQKRRNANRDRLKNGLQKAGKPPPVEFKSQGSYAMKTMVQFPDKDYDIDDGVCFAKADLIGPRGGEMSALEVRQMVRDGLDDGSFTKKPEVRTHCVRVYYEAGYHVDVPSYRRIMTKDALGNETVHFELASSEWKRSDARDVTTWFENENNRQSGDTTNGRQLRRITRALKKFAKSRASWKPQVLNGFGITKLVTECFKGNTAREDTALHDTMQAIRDRLNLHLTVIHPVRPADTITKGSDDPKAKFLRDELSQALKWLERLFDENCTRKDALNCWDKVYSTNYFSKRVEESADTASAASAAPAILTSGLLKHEGASARSQAAVTKVGGGRYA